jgi:hypothetical protein
MPERGLRTVFGSSESNVLNSVSLSSQSRAGTVPNSPFPAGCLLLTGGLRPVRLRAKRYGETSPEPWRRRAGPLLHA